MSSSVIPDRARRRIAALAITGAIVVALLPAFAAPAHAAEIGATVGDLTGPTNVTVTLDEESTASLTAGTDPAGSANAYVAGTSPVPSVLGGAVTISAIDGFWTKGPNGDWPEATVTAALVPYLDAAGVVPLEVSVLPDGTEARVVLPKTLPPAGDLDPYTSGGRVRLTIRENAGPTSSYAVIYVPLALTYPDIASATPVVSGSAVVGARLVANPGNWSADANFDYSWSRDGVPIPNANQVAYTVQSGDVGHRIGVTVSGHHSGTEPITLPSALTSVVTATHAILGAVPKVTGTPSVGNRLTALSGSWGPDGVALRYQWLRDGAPVGGARESTYLLAVRDAGHIITVAATGTTYGYTSVSQISLPVKIALQALSATPTPTITGSAKPGHTLTAVAGKWKPTPVMLSYQWNRNGVAITGADAPTYKLSRADEGSTITVTVSGFKEGSVPVSTTSLGALVSP